MPEPLETPRTCAGCDAAGVRLTPFTNGRSYCPRCAEEVEATTDLRAVRP